MNECFNKNTLYKKYIEEKDKEPIIESKHYSVSVIERSCIKQDN